MLKNGFTIVEVIIVVAFFSILAFVSVSFYQSFQVTYELNTSINELVQNLRRAQSKAMASEGDSKHGIYFNSGYGATYVLFKGNSYATRDTDYDEETILSNNINLTYGLGGGQEVVFSKFRGRPNNTGTITITSINGDYKTITINTAGRVKEE